MKFSSSITAVIKRPFRYLWLNQILLQFGLNMLNFALLIWVFRLTGSSTFVSIFILSVALPAILFGVFAGVVADVVDKRKLIILCDLGMAIAVFLLIFTGEKLLLILLLSFIFNSFIQFFIPAEGSAIPMLVKRSELLLANSLFFFTYYGSLIFGYTLSGPIVNLLGFNFLFIFVAVIFVLASISAWPIPTLRATGEKFVIPNIEDGLMKDIKKDVKETIKRIKEGLNFVTKNYAVWMSLLILNGFQGMIAIIATLIPGFFERVIRVSATDSYIILAPLGLGLLIGALFVGRFGAKTPKKFLILRGILVCGLMIILIGLLPLLGSVLEKSQFIAHRPRPFIELLSVSSFLALFSLILGFFSVQIIVPAQTSLQENSPLEVRGRVFSILAIGSALAIAISTLVIGPMADIFGILPMILITGGLIMIVGLLGFASFGRYGKFRNLVIK